MPKPLFKTKDSDLSSMIRVNHAGEYGAMRIYQGQMDATKDPETKKLISHMMEQESRHLGYFEEEMRRRQVRPTPLLPVWHYGAYALGFITSLIGSKTAMLCTQAVEEVIDEHYSDQLEQLAQNKDEAALRATIEEYRLEELEHKEIATEHGSTNAPFYGFFHSVIGGVCKVAIGLSKR
jgi:ubiquinone biosynthesis monooxygenase Coq7